MGGHFHLIVLHVMTYSDVEDVVFAARGFCINYWEFGIWGRKEKINQNILDSRSALLILLRVVYLFLAIQSIQKSISDFLCMMMNSR